MTPKPTSTALDTATAVYERKRGRGRPCLYTPEIAAEIIERISAGEPLEVICRDEHMPSAFTVHHWKSEDSRPPQVPATFAADFARAREAGFDVMAADCLDIADDTSRDWIEREDGGQALDAEHVQRSKLRIETRLKLLAKWSKRYSDKVTVAGDSESPLVIEIVKFGADQPT